MDHVDVIRNDWLAGLQRIVARAFVDDGAFYVTSDEKVWYHAFDRPYLDPESGDELYPQKDPIRYLHALPKVMQGSYVFVTEPHEEETCPYEEPQSLRMHKAGRQFA
jgi:hypothetical protein